MKIVDLLKPRLNDNAPLSRVVPMSEGAVIPRIIHQTYFSRNLPDELKENIERIKGMNPGWEYRYYDDSDIDDFIRTNYGQYVHELFSRINPKYGAARADLFRYLLMYKIGGVYLDIKSSTGRPLNDVLKPADRYLLSVWDNDAGGEHQGWGKHPELRHVSGGEFQQWHIVAAPGHPFLRVVIANVLRNIEIYNPLAPAAAATAPAVPQAASAELPAAQPVAEAAAATAEPVVATAPVAPPVAPAPLPAAAVQAALVPAFELPTGELEALAEAAGLQWVNSDADKIRAVQEAMAREPKPIHVPREPKPPVKIDEGPLVLVETRKDLSQIRLPFESGTPASSPPQA